VKGALDIHRELLDRGVAHEIVRLSRPVLSADELPDALGLPAERCVCTRMYAVDGEPVAVLTRAGELPEPGAVLHALAATTLQVAPPDLVNQWTDYAAALVAPLLLPVPVLADAAVGLVDVVYTPTGDSGTALGIHTRDLLVLADAQVTDLRSPAPPSFRGLDEISLADLERSVQPPH
jgi:prolyl-tRNA editing enzyme YbaK/EbsC (Cys-tRNA(Pro) deacylase)